MAKKTKRHGWICLALWAVLIIAGIVGKRVFHQPDLVVFFHLPGAVMLVLGWYLLSGDVRRRYAETCRERYGLAFPRSTKSQVVSYGRDRL